MTPAKYILFQLILIATLGAQPDRYGRPACASADQELADRKYFVLCHSASQKVPAWVGYELKPEQLAGEARRPHHFRRDAALRHEGARDTDYRGSGYSRGHMAPAADFAWSEDAVRATFLLSNAVPQMQSTNAGVWARLERSVRRLAADADVVYVFSGPLFEGPAEVIGAGQVAVPSHFFKAVLVERSGVRRMYAAIVPNGGGGRLERYLTTVEEVERRTGLDFFAELERTEQRELESVRASLPE